MHFFSHYPENQSTLTENLKRVGLERETWASVESMPICSLEKGEWADNELCMLQDEARKAASNPYSVMRAARAMLMELV